MTGPLAILIGLSLAVAIVIFFVNLDRVRQERLAFSDDILMPLPARRRASRAELRHAVDRVMAPIADILSDRNRRRGKRTLAEELAMAGFQLTSSEFLLLQTVLCAGLAVLGLWRFGFGPAFLLLGLAGFMGPLIYLHSRQGRRQREFNSQLGNTLTLLSNALKTGYSLGQAIDIIATKAAPPVSDEFARVVTSINLGTSIEDALSALVKRVDSPDLDFVVVAVLLHRKLGGNLAEILDNIGETIRERVRSKREMNVMTAHARASSSLISFLPVVLAVIMYTLTPAYFRPMLTNPLGWILIGIAGGLVVFGNMIMRRLAAVDA